jgi:protein-disulfide isomerase
MHARSISRKTEEQVRGIPYCGKGRIGAIDLGSSAVGVIGIMWLAFRPVPVAPATAPIVPTEAIVLEGSASEGAADAPIVLLAFSDFQCPYCARFAMDILPHLRRDYVDAGKLRVIFRNLPLTGIHPFAKRAAIMAECARRQGKFWPVHDALFGRSGALGEGVFEAVTMDAGIRRRELESCMQSSSANESLERDVESARKMAVTGTPTVFLGRSIPEGRVRFEVSFAGARPLSDYRDAIERLYSARG